MPNVPLNSSDVLSSPRIPNIFFQLIEEGAEGQLETHIDYSRGGMSSGRSEHVYRLGRAS